ERSRGTTSTNHCDLSAHEFARERRQSIHLTFCPAVFNADIAVLDIADLNEALPERGNGIFECSGRSAVEEPDHRYRRLLRACRERRCGHRAAQKRDELPASHRSPPGSKPRTASSHSRPGLGTGQGGCELRPIVSGWECRLWVPRAGSKPEKLRIAN